MFVDIEFFGEDPIDNIISCLKFRFDKVIFLGYADEAMDCVARETVERFLRSERIGVAEVQFVKLPSVHYEEVQEILMGTVRAELSAQNKCYMDLSGGDEIVLAAAGATATQCHVPMHEVDVLEDKVNILHGSEQYEALTKRSLYLGIEEFLNLHEAVIDWNRQKTLAPVFCSGEQWNRIMQMQRYMDRLGTKWNRVSCGLANLCARQSVSVRKAAADVRIAAHAARMKQRAFLSALKSLHAHGFLRTFFFDGEALRLDFFGEWEQDILCNPGAALEHYVYFKATEDPEVNECGLNCYLDWEGDGNPRHRDTDNSDVINEVDVLYMKKNIPTFISCKNKLVSDNQVLYELETVANRFGGTNARKILLARAGAAKAIKNRADEMGIRVARDI